MKLATNSSPVEYGSSEKPQAFQISASKEAFKILSSGLYNNKIAAIIRELSCNAYDAHVAAGKKEVPFDLHLPTTFEPHFNVKDYGTGLSHENILSLYTTYFGTDKSDSNDFVGALGLGSKSPFSYTDGFTVTSRFQGDAGYCQVCNRLIRHERARSEEGILAKPDQWFWKHPDHEDGEDPCFGYGQVPTIFPKVTRIYSAQIGSTGTPEIQLQAELDTPNETLGLEIMFPIRTGDSWEFTNNARSVLEFFNPLPNINTPITVRKTAYKVKSATWGTRDSTSISGVRAIQGMVPYSVGTIDESRLTPTQKLVNAMNIDIFFNIGDLSVAASRETLSNDDATVNAILKKYDEIATGMIDEVKKKLQALSSPWEARILIFSLVNTPGIGGIINDALNTGKFDGSYGKFILDVSNKPVINELDYDTITVSEFNHNWRSTSDAKKHKIFVLDQQQREQAIRSIANGSTKKASYNRDLESDQDVIFVIGDIAHGGERYVHFLIQEAADNKGLLVGRKKTAYLIARRTKFNTAEQTVSAGKQIIKKLGDPPFVLLSDLKAKYKPLMDVKNSDGKPVNRDILVFDNDADIHKWRDGYERLGWVNAWEVPKDPIPTGTKYYVPVKSLKPADESFEFAEDFKKFKDAVFNSKQFGFKVGDPIYAVQAANEILKNPEWVDFNKFIFTKLKAVMTKEKELALSLLIKPFEVEVLSHLETIATKGLLDAKSKLMLFAQALLTAQKADRVTGRALAVVVREAIRLKHYEASAIIDFAVEWRNVLLTYPLLGFMKASYYIANALDAVVGYATLVDANEELKQEVTMVLESNQSEEEVNVTN